MDVIFSVLIFLFIFFGLVILIGHGSWVALAWFVRQISGNAKPSNSLSLQLDNCPNCKALLQPLTGECAACGWHKTGTATAELFREIGATYRQLQRLRGQGSISEETYLELISALQLERERLAFPTKYSKQQSPQVTSSQPKEATAPRPLTYDAPSVEADRPLTNVEARLATMAKARDAGKEEVLTAFEAINAGNRGDLSASGPHRWSEKEEQPPRTKFEPVEQKKPRRPFNEILAAFMEQSNIRWGEIIGGLLIIGCSTALVISLWNEISRIPLLKFFIFTSVTAALFGIGLYTEHRWKLPTTSRGILTIATLLVPLNFLAIAAVSRGTNPSSAVVLASEIFAPALFFCLVYFAGRIITPTWPHLLVFGVLGSSIGQLLERHFAYPGIEPLRLVGLGLFPVICFVVATVWMLSRASREREIDEGLANTMFVTLGTSSFASLLSLGLLLFKVGQARETLVHLAPLLTLGGGPILVTGLILWKRVGRRELAAVRTAGTGIALIGALFCLAGIANSFPNPASVVTAAFAGFIIFTCVAQVFEQPRAHLLAALCFALGFVVTVLAASGQVLWQSPYHTSLLSDLYSIRSGQAMAAVFVLYMIAAEVLRRRNQQTASWHYLIASAVVGGTCLAVVTQFGLGKPGDPYFVAPIYTLLAGGAFYVAWRHQIAWICWIGSGVLLLALGQTLGPVLSIRFPWQAALLTHASVTSVAAIFSSRLGAPLRRVLVRPLNGSAILTSLLVIVAMSEAHTWEPTAMYAQRLFWLACIWLVMLWLNRLQLLFIAMQAALTWSVILAVKLGLQNYEWYAYVPNAWLHPWSLQIQGSVLLILSLAWMGVRIFVRRCISTDVHEPVADADEGDDRDMQSWADVAWTYLNASRTTLDRVLTWFVLAGFVFMGLFGVLQGVKLELTIRGGAASVWNIAGFPHEHSFGFGAWVVLGLLLVSMIVGLSERRKYIYVLGALVSLSVAVPLLAARWETSFAAASAWRWLAALFFILMSIPLWWRGTIVKQLNSFGWPQMERDTIDPVRHTRALLIILTLFPVLTLTLYPALKAIAYRPVHGPSGGFFYFVGDVISYSLPLVLVGVVLIGHAVREGAAGYAFASGVLFNLAVTVAQLLTVVSVGGSMNRVVLVQVVQLNVIATSCFALIWLATHGWWSYAFTDKQAVRAKRYLKIQIGIGLVIGALLIVPLALWLCARPTWAGIATSEAGNVRGWLATVITFIVAFWFSKSLERNIKAWLLFASAGTASALVAFSVSRSHVWTWAGYHALLVASIVTAWLMLLAAKLPEVLKRREEQRNQFDVDASSKSILDAEWSWDATLLAAITGVWIVFMSIRAAPSDTSRPWWSVGALIATSALAAGLNWETLSRGYLYAAALLVNLAASIWFLTYWSYPFEANEAPEFLHLNVVALSLPGVAWLWMELRARRADSERKTAVPSFHHLAAVIVVVVMAFLVCFNLMTDFVSAHFQLRAWVEWSSMLSAIVLMTACLWDRRARYAVAGLYLLGLMAAGLALARFDLRPDRLAWMLMLVMAMYSIGTGFIWKSREGIISNAGRLRIPARTESPLPGLVWLRVFNAVLSSSVIILAYWVVLRFEEWPMRFAAAVAVGTQGLSFGTLAQGEKRAVWQRLALSMLALGTVFFGWAWLVPGPGGTWLNRAVILMMVMFGMIALFGFGTDKAVVRDSDWTHAARSNIPWFAGTGAFALLFILVTEVLQQTECGGVNINVAALIVVAVTLLSASTLCIFFAVKPAHDPLELSEAGRMKYVYVAEALLALLFMHIRLTMPWLFTGFFAQYWPLVIVFLAFVGVGISEVLRIQGVLVVARPVERTGVFLPLLPVIGFWIIESRVDYSLVLFTIGLLYASLSILRRSFAFGILAALAGNAGLWHMLHQTSNYGFAHHPQLWIIPVAVCVLIAAHLNRESYTEEQMAGIRYVTLMMVYVSSTSDILINGVSESPWLPLALGGLSLVGVMSGIMLRVRAFLFLGATFLLIAIISMIWYASDNLGWTWLWWVAGIVTGALIIFTFALFEKKRNEMLQVLEDLRGWQK